LNDDALSAAIQALRANKASQDAWEGWYRAVYPFVMSTTYRLLNGNRYLAEECTQEVMRRVLQSLDLDSEALTPASMLVYLRQTAYSVVIDMARREGGSKRVMINVDEAGRAFPEPEDGRPDPERQALVRDSIAAALAQLNGRERMIAGSLVEGQSAAEIADSLGVSAKTASNYVAKVRAHMRKLLFQQKRP